MQSGRIIAALDVFHREPLPATHPLARAPNVVLTPHLGYSVIEVYRESITRNAWRMRWRFSTASRSACCRLEWPTSLDHQSVRDCPTRRHGRSRFQPALRDPSRIAARPGGETGIHKGLKILGGELRHAGSSPAPGTTANLTRGAACKPIACCALIVMLCGCIPIGFRRGPAASAPLERTLPADAARDCADAMHAADPASIAAPCAPSRPLRAAWSRPPSHPGDMTPCIAFTRSWSG